jgi:competence protein ComEC
MPRIMAVADLQNAVVDARPKAAVETRGEARPAKPPGYHPCVILLVAAAAGIVIDRLRPLPLTAWMAVSAGGLAGWIALAQGFLPHRFLSHARRLRLPAGLALLLAVLGLAAGWHHACWNLFGSDDLGLFARSQQQPVCIEAVALQTPRVVPHPDFNPLRAPRPGDEIRFEVELRGIRDGDQWRTASGRAAMTVEGLVPNLAAGDRFQAFAHLLPPEHALNPGEPDRAAIDRGRRITSHLRVTHPEAISLLSTGSCLGLGRILESVRGRGRQVLADHLQPQQANLASAVLLGLRDQLDPEETEAFQLTGTVHLLVIAGLHLGILAGFAGVVLRRLLPRRWGLLAVAAFTILYMQLVDAEPPVVRATVLIVALCAAIYSGRRRTGFNVLALAGLIVLAINPVDLFKVGPQLSFLCVAGLMAMGPILFAARTSADEQDAGSPRAESRWPVWTSVRRWLPRWALPEPQPAAIRRLLDQERSRPQRLLGQAAGFVRHLALVSGSIWLLTLPLVMMQFHIFNPISVIINTAVWLPMAGALLSGLALLLTSMIPGPLAGACAWACNGLLGLVEQIVQFGGRVAYGHTWVPGPAAWWLIGLYAGLGLFLAFPRLRPPVRWRLALLGAWTAVGVAIPWATTDRHGLRCTFLSVGHGEAIVLELPDGRTLLYDAGRLSAPVSCCRSISGYLWSRGLTHIDAVILSHADTDHYNALPGLLERFSVGAVYVSPVMFDNMNASLRFLREALDRARVPVREIYSGNRLSGGPGCTLAILHPPPHGLPSTSNANSIVVAVEYEGRRVILPADLQSPGLDDVLAERPLHCDMLLVPHHGSRSSMPAELSAWSTPDWAVFSADHRYDTSAVEAIYARRGRVLHTADTGAVMARVDEKGLRVETFVGGDRPR